MALRFTAGDQIGHPCNRLSYNRRFSMCHVIAAQRFILARINVADREASRVLDYEMPAFSQLNPPRPWESARAPHAGSPPLLLSRPRCPPSLPDRYHKRQDQSVDRKQSAAEPPQPN